MFDQQTLGILGEALDRLEASFAAMPPFDPRPDVEGIRRTILDTAERLQQSFPFAHPLYVGQMLAPPHPAARIAYALALWLNGNNHALDGGPAASEMEKEAVAEIARMFGWEPPFLGHLCGGGTVANLEALWVARELTDGRRVVASEQAHYTHPRLCGLLGLPFTAVRVDDRARMDADALERELERGDVGTVVATVGTTATGSCDPLPDILALRERYDFRLHCDTAYGGYFTLVEGLRAETSAVFARLSKADSIVVDPHKHGLQPYGCGCVLFRDPAVGRVYKHDSPYTYFTSDEMHLGEISLECSRPGAAAVALWATQRLLPLERGGDFAAMLGRCRAAAVALHARLATEEQFVAALEPELDIVVWTPQALTTAQASERSRALFTRAARENLHLALANLPARFFGDHWHAEGPDAAVTCLRSCLMKPEHLDWLDAIWERIARPVD